MSGKVTVLNPVGYPPQVAGRGLAPGLGTLEGKTVFLVDVGYENAYNFLEQLQGWFAEHMPAVSTRIVRWRDQHEHDPELAERIKADGDAAILGVGV